jgi:hypothetical protein
VSSDEDEEQNKLPFVITDFSLPQIFFWFDAFSVNQHRTLHDQQYTGEWWRTIFARNIEAIGTVLLVLTPWNDPVPLTRAW